MRNNTIVDKLRRSLECVKNEAGQTLPFVYEDKDIQNILTQKLPAPLVLCVPIVSSAVTSANGLVHERITLAVWFADNMLQGSGDFCAVENERIIDDCKQRAFKWVASLTPANELKLISINGAERAYLEMDDNLTGYMLNVTLEEMQGYGCRA